MWSCGSSWRSNVGDALDEAWWLSDTDRQRIRRERRVELLVNVMFALLFALDLVLVTFMVGMIVWVILF